MRFREFQEGDDLMYLRAIYVMQVIGKRGAWDRVMFRDFTCSAIYRRPFGHWPFLFHLMDYDKDFGGVRFGSRIQMYIRDEKINRMRAI